MSLMKDRTGQRLASGSREIKSIFHLTINPTARVNKETEPELYARRKQAMLELGEFLLQDDTIKSVLKFNPVSVRTGKGTWRTDVYPDEWHWDRVKYISDKRGAVEDSPKQTRIHEHLTFLICHTTNLQVDTVELEKLVMKAISSWSKGVFIKVRGGAIQNFFKDYVEKHLEYKNPDQWNTEEVGQDEEE